MPAIVGMVFFIIYALTAQQGISWQDSGEYQFRVLDHGVDTLLVGGIARIHPAYIGTCRAFVAIASPFASPCHAVTLFSGFCMAVALGLMSWLLSLCTGRRAIAAMAAASLGLAHMAWWLSCMAEVYTMSLAFIFAELLLLRKSFNDPRFWPLLFFVNALHLCAHDFALIGLAVYGISFLAAGNWKRPLLILPCIAAFALGGIPVWVLMVRYMAAGNSLVAAVSSLLFGEAFAEQVTGTGSLRTGFLLANLGLAAMSFVTPAWLFAASGFRSGLSGDKPFKRALIAVTALHALFWIRYNVPDQATFVLPTLGLLFLWAGIGMSAHPRRAVAAVAIGVALQLLAPIVATSILHTPSFESVAAKIHSRVLPYRDDISYWMKPWKHNEHSAEMFAADVLAQLTDGDMLFADNTPAAPILVARLLEKDKTFNWELSSPFTDESLFRKTYEAGRRNDLYVVSTEWAYGPGVEGARYEQCGVLYRLSAAPGQGDQETGE